MFFKRLMLWAFMLVSVGLFHIKYLSLSQIRLIQFLFFSLMMVSIIAGYIYGNVKEEKKRFLVPIIILLTGVFLSSIIARYYHEQSFLITFWAQSPMYWFVFYIFLSVYRFDKEELEKILIVFAFLYTTIYIFQFLLYPTIYFDVRIDQDPVRGTIRIFMSGYPFLLVGFYMFLNKFLNTNKLNYLVPLLLFFSVTILQASRQHVFAVMLVTIYAIFFTKKVKSRGFIIFLIILSILPVFYLFQDIFLNLIELTTAASQGADVSASARERALRFFLFDFQPSTSSYILGNGADHMRSPYGLKMLLYRRLHFYLSDIGLIGEYVKYGAVFVIGAIFMLYKMLKIKLNNDLNYIKYYAINIIILLPLASFFISPYGISVLCIIFHIIDVERNKSIG